MKLPKITFDYLEKLDNGSIKDNKGKTIKICDLTNDRVFKVFFKSNEDIFKRFLATVLHFNYINPNDLKLNFIDKELFEVNTKKHGTVYDYFITINDNIYLDVELNGNYFEVSKNKSFIYQAREISSSLNASEEYQSFSKKKFIQLNLNAKEKEYEYGEEIIYPYSITRKSIYMDNVITYLRYLECYRKMYYTNISDMKESDYWLAMLTAKSFTELYNILDSFLKEDIRNRIIRDVIRISMKNLFTEQELINLEKQVEMDREEYFKKVGLKEGKAQGIIEGKIEGKIEGLEEGKIQIAKTMLEKNMSVDAIAEITKLSIEKVEELKRNL